MKKISRREIGKIVAGVTAASALPRGVDAQAPAPSSYIGPLTGVTAGIEGRSFDPVAYTRELYAAAPRRLKFEARTKAQAEAWQQALRTKVTELLGGFPSQRVALAPVVLETRQFPGYRREKIVFNTRAGVSALAYVLVPGTASASADVSARPASAEASARSASAEASARQAGVPVVICVPGHGRGVDDIVGIDDKGQDRTDKAGYQRDFALQVVEAGMAAVAIEPMAFGARRDAITARKGLGTSACQPAAGGAMLVGETILGWRVWDVMRTVDYIQTRPELDASRVGLMGISGGGTVTLFGAALDPRIKAALVSGYLNTFVDSIGSLSHCIDNYVPGILNWAEMHDIGGLIAPRPLFSEAGERDNIFPIKTSVESFNRVKDIYTVFGAAERIEQEVFPDEHVFWGKKGIPFLVKHL